MLAIRKWLAPFRLPTSTIERIGDLLSGDLQRLRAAPLVQASRLEPAREPDKDAAQSRPK